MALVSPYTSTITLNGLNLPITRHRMAGWIKKARPNNTLPKDTHFSSKDTNRIKVKRQQKVVVQGEFFSFKAGIAILTLDKIDIKPKRVTRA